MFERLAENLIPALNAVISPHTVTHEDVLRSLSLCPFPERAQFTLRLFEFAKASRTSPIELAKRLSAHLSQNSPIVETAQAFDTHHIALLNIDVHPVDRYLGACAMLGLDDGAADFSFPIPPEANGRIDALLDYYEIAKADLAVIAPGTIWETKQWGAAGFAAVARAFLEKRFAVTLIGSGRSARRRKPSVATASKAPPFTLPPMSHRGGIDPASEESSIA